MPPETVADRYLLKREIGRGGMGSVWLATDDRLGRLVALKRVGSLPGQSAPDLARALREARSSAALNHPHVVALYDVLEEGGVIWLVMEYVPGRTLGEIVAQDGPLSPERTAWIGAQVASGLQAAHGLGMVHRDVKPGNILVTDDDRAKISDFGIARTIGDDTLTQSGFTTGTPAYFSPELARGQEPTPAADVWGLGATLYAAVEGRMPYPDRPNALAMLATIADGPPAPPEHAGALAEPLRRMLDPDPVSRWQIADCVHALRQVHLEHADDGATREHEPMPTVAATPASTPEPSSEAAPGPTAATEPHPTQRRRRRGPLLVTLAVLLLAGVVALGVLSSLDGDGAPSADPSSTTESSSGTSEPDPTPSEPSSDPTTGEPSEPATSADAPASGGRGAQGFIEDYYAALPEDTEAGWSMLSTSFQDEIGEYGDYDGFWSTIDGVTVDDTTSAGRGAVEVTVTYVSDGDSEQEVRLIEVDRADGGFEIVDDEVVG